MIKLANVKSCIKYYCGKVISRRYTRKLQTSVREAEIISFDLFDTLIKRNVAKPEHVHKLVQSEFFRQTGIKLIDYEKYRIAAEKRARKKSSEEEISLDEIFDELSELSEEWKNILKKIERHTEIEICTPNLQMQPVYEYALKERKRITITSDMYLDEYTIRQILRKCGYNLYEKLYLSSSFRLSKSRGSIFEIIKRDYGSCGRNILHIGDNVKGDYVIPRKKGINALLVDGQPELLRYWKKSNKVVLKDQFLYQRLYCFLNNQVGNDYDDAKAIGYEILGPLLLGYCKWLYQKLKDDKIEKIFFLSREGKILQEAFHILYPECEIEQTYLYVSRQALTIPQLADAVDFDEMAEIFKCFFYEPLLSEIPSACDFNRKEFADKLSDIGLKGELSIDRIPKEKKNELYLIIQELGRDKFSKQKEYVIKYLKEKHFWGNIAIVDIGWSGTMQKALQNYSMCMGAKLHGYYIGVRNLRPNEYYTELNRSGYLFDWRTNKDFNLMFRFTTEIIELLFLNTEGTLERYGNAGEHIVPVLSEPEYIGLQGDLIVTVQSAAMKFLNKIKEDESFKEDFKITEAIIMSSYNAFGIKPTLNTLSIFDRFQFLNGQIKKILPERGFFYYLIHPCTFKHDFGESYCKIFFLKKIFKIKLPYFNILKLFFKWYDTKNKYFI